MDTIKVSATHARNNFFTLLDKVANGAEVIVEKDKKEVAVISSKKIKTDLKGLKKVMDALHGVMPDFDLEDSPLRGKKSQQWLKKIKNY